MRKVFWLLPFLFIMMVSGCRPGPGQDSISDALAAHFQSRGYAVEELELGEIQVTGRGQSYGRQATCRVTVKRLVLRAEGQQSLAFSNVAAELEEVRGKSGVYRVTSVTGVPLL